MAGQLSDILCNKILIPGTDSSEKENYISSEMKTSRKNASILMASNGRLKGQFKIMSDDEIANNKGKMDKKHFGKRRSLAPLQQSVEGKNILTGHVPRETMKDIITENAPVEETQDKKVDINKNFVLEGVDEKVEQKETLVEDALNLMKTTEQIGEGYWKSIAEERRLALEETLEENDKLYDEIDGLKQENGKIRKSLSEMECYKMLYLQSKRTVEHA